MTTPTMTSADALRQYAACVWEPGDLIELRPVPTNLGRRDWIMAAKLPDHADRLAAENARGAHLYAGVLPRLKDRGGSDKDCAGGLVVWADFDHMDPEKAQRTATDAGLPKPSMVVNSGHGAHLYWRLYERQDPESLSALVGDIAALVGSDPSVKNPSRILRLPGFTNHKKPAASCDLLYAESDRHYSFAELRELVPSIDQSRTKTSLPSEKSLDGQQGAPECEERIERARRYMAKIEGSGKGGRRNAAYKVAVSLVKDFNLSNADALPILEGWDREANSPPIVQDYGDVELSQLLANARRYGKHTPGEKAASAGPRYFNQEALIRLLELRQGTNPIPHAAVTVGVALANHMDRQGKCWPSRETLAKKTVMDRRNLSRCLRTLEHSGFIKTEARAGNTNVYQLTLGKSDTPPHQQGVSKKPRPLGKSDRQK